MTDVRRFLGFTNFFRRFIKDYSVIARPLEELTGKYARFTWETDQEKAFRELREALLKAPVLKLADVKKPFHVMSDASDSAIGGVLLQQDDEGDWHCVAYTSRRLSLRSATTMLWSEKLQQQSMQYRHGSSTCLSHLSW